MGAKELAAKPTKVKPKPAKPAPAGKKRIHASRIRAAKLSDLAALSLLFDAYRVFYRKTSDVKLARRFIANRLKQKDSVVFVAENPTGELLGFVQLYPSFSSTAAAPIYVLNDLFVAPKGRQQGLGEALMRMAAEFAKKKKCARLDLGTERTNRVAQRLYEKMGYQKNSTFFFYSFPLS